MRRPVPSRQESVYYPAPAAGDLTIDCTACLDRAERSDHLRRMKNWENIDEILEFAIAREQEAVDFYTELAGKTKNAHARASFKQFAEEEKGHKRKLLAVKEGGIHVKPGKKVLDLKMADYLVDVKPHEDMDYQYALILAMKREKSAFRLYTDLAEQVKEKDTRSLFLALAQEEARHKLRFEIEYDDEIFAQN